ncbi:MAG: phosphotransferase [Chloroflexota bacterium]|jgi:hypothetical protein|nr:phosphotransferase [Chloroflexota bacterium]
MHSTDVASAAIRAICAKLLPEFDLNFIEPAAIGHSVYRIVSAKGDRLALKLFADSGDRSSGPEALATEAAALDQLHRLGCPVPRLVAADPNLGALAMEWIDGRTLEARLQGRSLAPSERESVLRSLAAMEAAYQALTARREPAAVAAHRELITRTRHELTEIADCPPVAIDPADRERWAGALEDAADAVTAGPWSYGSLDCSASNLLLAGDRAYVIDLSILGAEWRERRTVRHAIATGSSHPEGRYASLFNSSSAATYSQIFNPDAPTEAVAQLLDLHHLLVLFGALARQRRSPNSPADRERRRSLFGLFRRPLVPGGIAGALRDLLRPDALEWANCGEV